MQIVWGRVLPVIVSITLILIIAVLREYSKTLAAIASTMPINIPLGMWIVYSGTDTAGMEQFTRALLINIWPTIVFLVIAWLMARAGYGVLAMIVVGYIGWGIGLGIMLLLRQTLGI